ncbi:hypothetical protein TRFO_40457 [Tritrichomonas foetus]|uniref:Calpain catalytic domain-containing protein n=1 Tax=Tritrichomonas foetus TaxID=1144522 RepID=A0A1J4J137_9EUKA|nr:hypothetical protein TRFO_40457 [Tritrichomonas foetus]|eukprot:OHS93248.1 hypothetical protein TRFO_40457 [Tritrichomonas foetus]
MKKYEDFEKEAASYQLILQRYKKTGVLYEDPNFHPKRKIKENKVKFDGRDIVWNRVDKYFKSPLYENISKDAVQQGELGDCYFISTLSRIGKQKELVKLLFDPISDVKCGAVIVYFYAYGRRTPILIDTLLPFKLGTRTPIFSHPSDITYSAWFTLVEKAFAKLNGSYSNIVCGQFAHAVYSLFGYHPFSKTIENIKGNPFDKLMKYQRIGALIGTSIHSTTKASQEEIQKNGLVQNHSYLVLKARTVEGKNFLCLRNPWGNDREWLGDWSDTSELWTPSLKKALSVKFGNDGSFWMIDKDFFKYFTDLEVSKPVNPRWHCRSFHTQLKPGPHDGRQYTDPGSKMAQRDTYVFRIDSDEAIKIYIRCEKRASPDYESSKLQILLCNTKGQKITPEIIPYSSRQTFTTSNEIAGFSKMIEKPKEEGWTIVILRTTAMKIVEDVYVQLYCEKDFTLYNVDTPNVLIPEDEKTGILFDNSSVLHPNVAPTLKTIPINGKDVQVLSSL